MHGSERELRYSAARAVAEPVLEARDISRDLSHTDTSTLLDPNSLRLLGMAAHAIGDFSTHGRCSPTMIRQSDSSVPP